MLKEILKPKLKHSNPEIRIQALSELNIKDQEDLQVIQEIAEQDDSLQVRKAAVNYLKNLETLQKIHQQETEAEVISAVEQRVLTIMNDPAEEASFETKKDFICKHNNLDWLVSLTSDIEKPELRLALLESLTEAQLIGYMVVHDPSHEIRVKALEKLTDIDVLTQVVKDIRNKDKGLHRSAQQRLDELVAISLKPKQIESEWEVIKNGLLYLQQVDRWNTPELEQLRSLDTRFANITDDLDENQKHDYHQSYEKCQLRYQDYIKAQKEKEALQQKQMEFCEEIEEFVQQYPTLEELSQEKIDEFKKAWSGFEGIEPLLQNRFDKTIKALEDRLHRLQQQQDSQQTLSDIIQELEQDIAEDKIISANELKRIKQRWQQSGGILQEDIPKDSQERFDKALHVLEEKLSNYQEKIKTAEAELTEKLEGLEGALAAGELHTAQPLRQRCLELKSDLPPSNPIRKKTEKALRSLESQLKELEDWQYWGSIKTRESLCERMESLINNVDELHPEELYKRIRVLQDEWKQVDKVDTASGRKLWPRFNQAMQRAYEPCRHYFEEQAKVKEANYQEGIQLCEEIEKLVADINWENVTDWQSLDKLARDFREKWRQLGTMRPKDRRELQKRYRAIMQTLTDYLSEERERNLTEKEKLIEEAQTLKDMEDLNRAIQKAKDLQSSWKTTVSAKPSQERKMREKFKAACDVVFDRRRAEIAEREKERQEKTDAKQTIYDQLVALTTSEEQEITALKSQLKDLQSQWKNLPILDQKDQRGWDKKFSQAAQKVEKHFRKLEKADQIQQIEQLKQKGLFIASVEAKTMDIAAAEEQWTGFTALLDSELEERLQTRWEQAKSYLEGNAQEAKWNKQLEENTNESRLLAVRLEILTGVESPADAAQERMAYQVSRLSMAMQQRPNTAQKSDNDPVKLLQEFYLLGPVNTEQHTSLVERMEKVFDKVFG